MKGGSAFSVSSILSLFCSHLVLRTLCLVFCICDIPPKEHALPCGHSDRHLCSAGLRADQEKLLLMS